VAAPAYVTGAGQAASQVDLNGVATNITYSGGKIIVFACGTTGEAASAVTFGGANLTFRGAADAGTRAMSVWTGDPSNELAGVATGTRGALITGAGSNSACVVIEVSGAADGAFDLLLSEATTTSPLAETVGDVPADRLLVMCGFGQVGSIALDSNCTSIFNVAQANRSTRAAYRDLTAGAAGVTTSTALGATVVQACQIVVTLAPPAGDIEIPADPAFENDSAGTLVPVKYVAITRAYESVTAFARAAARLVAPGLASESDSAAALVPVKLAALSPAGEIDRAYSLADTDIEVPADPAFENDSAGTLAPVKLVPVGKATEATTATSRPAQKHVALTRAYEAASAFALAVVRRLAPGLASESDSAQALAPVKRVSVGLAQERDRAYTLADVAVFTPVPASRTRTPGPYMVRSRVAARSWRTHVAAPGLPRTRTL
jgi:hypothetical protein